MSKHKRPILTLTKKLAINQLKCPNHGIPIAWRCDTCHKLVFSERYPDGQHLPESKYWNIDREEVYCSAHCSLVAHEKAEA